MTKAKTSKTRVEIPTELLKHIPVLREQGLSFYDIGKELGIGSDSVREYYRNGIIPSYISEKYEFTDAQIDIAVAVLNNQNPIDTSTKKSE